MESREVKKKTPGSAYREQGNRELVFVVRGFVIVVAAVGARVQLRVQKDQKVDRRRMNAGDSGHVGVAGGGV
jgi:hypothetical protein